MKREHKRTRMRSFALIIKQQHKLNGQMATLLQLIEIDFSVHSVRALKNRQIHHVKQKSELLTSIV